MSKEMKIGINKEMNEEMNYVQGNEFIYSFI